MVFPKKIIMKIRARKKEKIKKKKVKIHKKASNVEDKDKNIIKLRKNGR